MDLWYTEKQTPHTGITCSVRQTVYRTFTQYQDLAVLDTHQFGRMLVLDGMVQMTEEDEFIYHEMIAHIPMFAHPSPQEVLVIGGGDGGTIREIVKHPGLQKVTLVEIDGGVIEASRTYLPSVSGDLDHPRVEVRVEDGYAYISHREREYDVVIVDSTEPIGPAENLFTETFYHYACRALKDDGMLVAQTESPFYNRGLIRKAFKHMNRFFPIVRMYLASIPTYPSGLWSFTAGSKLHDPLMRSRDAALTGKTHYYSPEIHFASFSLPPFVAELMEGGDCESYS